MQLSQTTAELTILQELEQRITTMVEVQRQIFNLLVQQSGCTPSTMTLKEAADYARYSTDHFRRLSVEQRRIPFFRPANGPRSKLLFKKEDIDAFLGRSRVESVSRANPGRRRKDRVVFLK